MACIIFGAGSYYGLIRRPEPGDYIIAADGGWQYCKQEGIVPDLLLGDFDSLAVVPDFAHIHRVPVEKDDSDMMLAIKDGLSHGQKEFHLYGGMGGVRSDHTLANIQSLLYLTCHGARGWLYGDKEQYTVIRNESIMFPSKERGIMSVFCMGADAGRCVDLRCAVSAGQRAAVGGVSIGCQQSFYGQSDHGIGAQRQSVDRVAG